MHDETHPVIVQDLGSTDAVATARNDLQTTLGSPYQDRRINPCPVPGQQNCAFQTGPYIFLGQSEPSAMRMFSTTPS